MSVVCRSANSERLLEQLGCILGRLGLYRRTNGSNFLLNIGKNERLFERMTSKGVGAGGPAIGNT